MAIGTLVGVIGAIGAKKNQKKLDRELKKAPKYKITDEAYENQNLARSQAYGQNPAIQNAQRQLDQDASDSVSQAKDITSNTSSLLSTIAAINANKNASSRALAGESAAIKQQNMQQLYGANNAMIDEKDKAWNYNQNMPFQMRVAAYRDRIKANQEQQLAGLAYEGQTVSSFASMMGGMMGGGGCDRNLKENIVAIESGIDAVMELTPVAFDYTHPMFNDRRKHNGFIAQQVEEVVPNAVSEITQNDMPGIEPGFLKINYNELVPVLVKAIQEQQQQIQELKEQLSRINNEIHI